MFDWDNKEDRSILEGKMDFQFRISDVPDPNTLEKVSFSLREMLYSIVPDLMKIEFAKYEAKKGDEKAETDAILTQFFKRKKGLWKLVPLFQTLTGNFELVNDAPDFDFILLKLAMRERGFVHFLSSDSFLHAIGSKVKLIPSSKNDTVDPTIMFLVLFEVAAPKNLSPIQTEMVLGAYAFVLQALGLDWEKVKIHVGNCLKLMTDHCNNLQRNNKL